MKCELNIIKDFFMKVPSFSINFFIVRSLFDKVRRVMSKTFEKKIGAFSLFSPQNLSEREILLIWFLRRFLLVFDTPSLSLSGDGSIRTDLRLRRHTYLWWTVGFCLRRPYFLLR